MRDLEDQRYLPGVVIAFLEIELVPELLLVFLKRLNLGQECLVCY